MTTTQDSIMGRLRAETAEQHQHAEGRDLEQALIRGTLPRPVYVDLLAQRFVIHRALEAAVRELAARRRDVAAVVDEALFQEANLRADLAYLGVDPESVQPLAATRALLDRIAAARQEQPAALLGIYYVFEGSKNGARFVAAKVRPTYGLEQDGTRYLDPHGDDQRPLWQGFRSRMEALDLTAEERERIVAAAKATFDAVAAIDDELYRAE